MDRWIDFSKEERAALVHRVVRSKRIDEVAAEKDWWVTAVLHALFSMRFSGYLLFKGGTSLSKGWNIINRFSEDIDLAMSRDFFRDELRLACAECKTNTQIHNLREKAQDFIFGEFKDELEGRLTALGLDVEVMSEDEMSGCGKVPHDKDPSVLYVVYKSIFARADSYASPLIKLEISVLSMREPFEERLVSSLLSQVMHNEDGLVIDKELAQVIPIVSPSRTFLEKAFLLCEEYQKKDPRTYRMSRHLYDLERLSGTEYAAKALSDKELYKSIVEHRRRFYHAGYVDYEKDMPSHITIVPPAGCVDDFRDDYDRMRKTFIYGESASFDDLIARMESLQARFRGLPF